MPIPLAVAAPIVATAAWAYLDAKLFLSYDFGLIYGGIAAAHRARKLETNGRLNIFYLLEEQAQNPKNENREFLVFQGKSWTYPKFYETVLKYGQWLKNEHGVKAGDVIALDCMNRPNFLFIWFGLWSVGAACSMINYNLTGQPLLHSLRVSDSGLVLVDRDVESHFTDEVKDELSSPNFRKSGGSVKISVFSDSLEDHLANTNPVREPDSCREATSTTLAALIFTSGTTGNPKASYIHWIRMRTVMGFAPGWLKLTPDDRFYTSMPLYHSAAMTLAVLSCLSAGCTAVIGHKFGTRIFWEDVRQSKATGIQYVGETCRYLLSAPPSPLDKQNDVRFAFGNGLRPDIWDEFKERFGISTINEFYAATEGLGSGFNRSQNSLTKGAIGRAGRLARLLNRRGSALVYHDHESALPVRDPQTGFCVKIDWSKEDSPPGEWIFRLPDDKKEASEAYAGYYGNKEASDQKIIHDVFEKGDAWYRTGDLVNLNPLGFVYFADRIGDTFRWKSENVSTNQVADAISSHPSISESNVYGVSLPNHDGRAGCATIILLNNDGSEKSDSTKVDSQTLSSIAQHALKNLPRYAVPVFLRFTRDMERTGTNKQQKHHLREQGVDPEKVGPSGDKVFWLKNGTYQPFSENDWRSITDGKVRL